jgi:hypothetical protein
VEDAQEAPDVVLSMFLINATTAIVLFDFGASHSFIPTTYAEKYNMPVAIHKSRMLVSSPGGDMPAKQVCLKVNLQIRWGRIFSQPYSFGLKGHCHHSGNGLA